MLNLKSCVHFKKIKLSIAEYEEKVQKKNRGQRLETLAGSMDAWRERNRKATKGVDVVQAVREDRDSR